jgi:tetratricopeptide (TPR) repeat protein
MRIALSAVLLAGAAAGQAVREDQTPLRAGCGAGSESVAVLAKGAAVRIRYALAGSDQPCYAVTVEAEGRRLQGYLGAEALEGLDSFDAARRRASSATLPVTTRSQVEGVRERIQQSKYALAADVYRALDALENGRPGEVEQILARTAPGHREVALVRAAALLELNQPDKALGLLEAALRQSKQDAQLLALAGMAAYKLDDPRTARVYWQESVALRRDPGVEEMLRRLERETGADRSTEKAYGMRFVLRYDGAVAAPDTARRLVDTLEREYSRISSELGCRAEERITTIVQSKESYHRATGALEWNGGQFDGRIRIPMQRARQIDAATREALAHELVHACLANLGRWPTWLHEALAQKLAGESLAPPTREQLRLLARAGKLPKLSQLGENWWRLNAEEARLRYGLALLAAEALYRSQGAVSVRNLLNNPERLLQTAQELDRAVAASLP